MVCGGFWELLTRVQLVICLEIVDCGQLKANNWHQHEITEELWKHSGLRWTVLLQTEFVCLWKNWHRKTPKRNEMKTVVLCGGHQTLKLSQEQLPAAKGLFSNVSDANRKDRVGFHQHVWRRWRDATIPTCGWLGVLSHVEVVWESFLLFFFSCCWLRRQGKQPLWQSGLELYAKYTLSSCCN